MSDTRYSHLDLLPAIGRRTDRMLATTVVPASARRRILGLPPDEPVFVPPVFAAPAVVAAPPEPALPKRPQHVRRVTSPLRPTGDDYALIIAIAAEACGVTAADIRGRSVGNGATTARLLVIATCRAIYGRWASMKSIGRAIGRGKDATTSLYHAGAELIAEGGGLADLFRDVEAASRRAVVVRRAGGGVRV